MNTTPRDDATRTRNQPEIFKNYTDMTIRALKDAHIIAALSLSFAMLAARFKHTSHAKSKYLRLLIYQRNTPFNRTVELIDDSIEMAPNTATNYNANRSILTRRSYLKCQFPFLIAETCRVSITIGQ